MSDERGRWAKQKKERNKAMVLKVIEKEQPIQNKELKKIVPFSEPTLAKYLREMISESLIEFNEDSKDGRIKWYKIKAREKANLQIRKYEAIQFIEDLPDPIYGHKIIGNSSVSAFIGPVTNSLYKGTALIGMKSLLLIATNLLTKLQGAFSILYPDQRVAVIFTVEGKQGRGAK